MKYIKTYADRTSYETDETLLRPSVAYITDTEEVIYQMPSVISGTSTDTEFTLLFKTVIYGGQNKEIVPEFTSDGDGGYTWKADITNLDFEKDRVSFASFLSTVNSVTTIDFSGANNLIDPTKNLSTLYSGNPFSGSTQLTYINFGDYMEVIPPVGKTPKLAKVRIGKNAKTFKYIDSTSYVSSNGNSFHSSYSLSEIEVDEDNETLLTTSDRKVLYDVSGNLIAALKGFEQIPNEMTVYCGYCFFDNNSSQPTNEFHIGDRVTEIKRNSLRVSDSNYNVYFGNSVIIYDDSFYRGNCHFDSYETLLGCELISTYSNDSAFHECSLYIDGVKTENLVIPSGVVLKNDVLKYCKTIKSIAFSDSQTQIPARAFHGTTITAATIPSSVTSIGGNAFENCTSLVSVEIPSSVTTIGRGAFANCTNLSSISLANGVETIDYYAFSGCSLTSIEIPSSVKSVQSSSFPFNRMTSISVQSGNQNYDSRDNCNALIETSTNTLIVGCSNSTIPDSVTVIGYMAFDGCSGLTGTLVIPNSVTAINDNAFNACSGLTGTLVIPDSVTTIKNYAFGNCKGLSSITIGRGITLLDGNTFDSCTGLSSITCFAETPPRTGYYFIQNTNNCPVYVPSQSVDAYKTTNYWSNYASRIQAIQ